MNSLKKLSKISNFHSFQSLFMLLLLLLAMGWAVTRHELKCKTAIFTIWLSYCIVHCLLYVWKRVKT